LTKDTNATFERYFGPRGELEVKALGLDALRGKLCGPKPLTDISSIIPPDAEGGDNHPCTRVEAIGDAEMGSPTQSHDGLCDRIESNNSHGMKRKPAEDSDSHAIRDVSNGIVTGEGRKRLKVSIASHVLDLEEF